MKKFNFNVEFNEDHLSTRVRLNENLKPESSMLLSSHPDLLAELKRVHLQCYVWLNALKPSSPDPGCRGERIT